MKATAILLLFAFVLVGVYASSSFSDKRRLTRGRAQRNLRPQPTTEAPVEVESDNFKSKMVLLLAEIKGIKDSMQRIQVKEGDDDEKVALKEIVLHYLGSKLKQYTAKLMANRDRINREVLREKCTKTFGNKFQEESDNAFTDKFKSLAKKAIEKAKKIWQNLDKCEFCRKGCTLFEDHQQTECSMGCDLVCAGQA
ncbi:hypothetical protein AKO1_014987 [Acrasis kona]|uniref:Uncharacterized protein n=1 Tax=Acrasis kona TaxID=1008807 RepID=A0AAW2YZX9_9EUKA